MNFVLQVFRAELSHEEESKVLDQGIKLLECNGLAGLDPFHQVADFGGPLVWRGIRRRRAGGHVMAERLSRDIVHLSFLLSFMLENEYSLYRSVSDYGIL